MSNSHWLQFASQSLQMLMSGRGRRPRARRQPSGLVSGNVSLEARVLLSSAPVGDEFRVNPSTQQSGGTGLTGRTVAFADDGSFVSVWTAWREDFFSDVTYLQRFDAEGSPLGEAMIVNGNPFGANNVGSIAIANDGSFVVTWWNPAQNGVYSRRFDAEGTPLGADLLVSDGVTAVNSAAMAMNPDGTFVVSWGYGHPTGPVMARLYNSEGQALGNEFQVGNSPSGESSVAMSAAGDFVVTWTAPDGNGDGIFGQRFDADGTAIGSVFRINDVTADNQRDSSVAMNPDGSFIVVWTSTGQDGDGDGIYAKRYDASGNAIGPEFRVNSTTASAQYQPAAATAGEAGFVISWTSIGQDGDDRGIFAQWFSSTGTPLAGEVQVNSTAEGIQWFSSVAMASTGETVFNWSSSTPQGVYGQRFRRFNSAPTDISLEGETVVEGSPAGTVVGTLSGTDPDFLETFTFSLVSGAGSSGNDNFEIVGDELRTAAVFDFESQASYSIRVRVTDSFGETFEKVFTIHVLDGVAPELTLSNQSVAENEPRRTVVGAFAVNDVDDARLRYSLVGGEGSSGNRYFSIVGDELRTNARFDFEKTSSYSIRVRVRGADGYEHIRVFTINVTDVNEAPTRLSLSSNRVVRGQPANTSVGQFLAADSDADESLTFSLVSGHGDRDNALFSVVGDTLQTAAEFRGVRRLSIRVRVTDSAGNSLERVFRIRVVLTRQPA